MVTEKGAQLEFAQICVEIRVDKMFLNFIDLVLPSSKSMELKLEYNQRSINYLGCNSYGHEIENCRNRVKKRKKLRI